MFNPIENCRYSAHATDIITLLFQTIWNRSLVTTIVQFVLPGTASLLENSSCRLAAAQWKWKTCKTHYEKWGTHNWRIGMLDVLCSVFLRDTAPTEIHHFNSKDLSYRNFCHGWYIWVPPVVKWKLLFPWLLFHVYRHNQSRSIRGRSHCWSCWRWAKVRW